MPVKGRHNHNAAAWRKYAAVGFKENPEQNLQTSSCPPNTKCVSGASGQSKPWIQWETWQRLCLYPSFMPRKAKGGDLFLTMNINQITHVSLQFLLLNFRFILP